MEADTISALAKASDQNKNERDAAIRWLDEFYQNSYSEYTLTLSTILATEHDNVQDSNAIRFAAGNRLKNTLSSKEDARKEELLNHWQAMNKEYRERIKHNALQALCFQKNVALAGHSHVLDGNVRSTAGLVIAAIAEIELSRGEWPELLANLDQLFSTHPDKGVRVSALQTIGYICEETDISALSGEQSGGARNVIVKSIKDPELILPGLKALTNSCALLKEAGQPVDGCNEILDTICQCAAQTDNDDIQMAAFECLVQFMSEFYSHMRGKMDELTALTIQGMGLYEYNGEISLQAIEFWSSVCDMELYLQDGYEEGNAEEENQYFANQAWPKIVPALLDLLTKQEEGSEEGEWTVSRSAATCLSLFSQCVNDDKMIGHVIGFVEINIGAQDDWRKREAAVMAFVCLLEGPNREVLQPLVQKALGTLIDRSKDPQIEVRDTVSWAFAQICELYADFIDESISETLLAAFMARLQDTNSIVTNCCWAIDCLTKQLVAKESESLSLYVTPLVDALVKVTESDKIDGSCRLSAYEAISTLVENAPPNCRAIVQNVLNDVLQKLSRGAPMQTHCRTQEFSDLHSSLFAILTSCARGILFKSHEDTTEDTTVRVENGDAIMGITLSFLKVELESQVILGDLAEGALNTMGALAAAVGTDFSRYATESAPYVQDALTRSSETQLLLGAIHVVGDICHAMKGDAAHVFDLQKIMESLGGHLMNPIVDATVKPAVLACFGDIALALREHIQIYLDMLLLALLQAGQMRVPENQRNNEDVVEHVNELHESNVEALVGIVEGLRGTQAIMVLFRHLGSLFNQFLAPVTLEYHPESLTRGIIGLLGDLAESFIHWQQQVQEQWQQQQQQQLDGPQSSQAFFDECLAIVHHVKPLFSEPWIDPLLMEGRLSRDATTVQTAKYCKEELKKVRN